MVSLEPGETGQVLFPHKFSEAGSSCVTVKSEPDALDSDNRRSSSIAVLDRLGVLLVDGCHPKMAGENDFLKIALTPFEEAQTKKHSGERFDRGIRNSGRQTDPRRHQRRKPECDRPRQVPA